MPITYDIRSDFLYKKGKEEGREEERQLKERIFVTRSWKKGIAPEEIAELADMKLEKVLAIIREPEEAQKNED